MTLESNLTSAFQAVGADMKRVNVRDITIKQNSNGSWPTVTRQAGVHYRWLCLYDTTIWPTAANGAAAGDELVGPDATSVP